MIGTTLFGCIVFAIFGVSWSYQDLYIVPVCENKGPDDVYLDLSEAGFNELSKSSMFEPKIKCLNLERNMIRTIEKDAFDDLPELYYLNLAKNPIDFQDFISTNISNLKTLILDGPFMDSYNDYNNGYFSEDVTFWNENNNRQGSVFLPQLRKLSLRYYRNKYSDLIGFWPTTLKVPMLTHLYLSRNDLTTIPNLPGISNLTHLNLDDNNMAHVSGAILKNVEYLTMDRNGIKNVCGTFCTLHSIAPRGMHNLKYLSLANNKIERISSDAFQDLENLLILNLAGNMIIDFQPHTFDNRTKLQNLTLDNNFLTRVPDIHALQELEILSLNGNHIVVIDQMIFSDMRKLAMIYLRNNGITTIANSAFSNLPALAILDLSWNNIHFLPEAWIWPNNSLKVLHLNDNKFTDTRNMTLEQLHNLEALNLARNPIKKMSVRSLMKLAPDAVIDVSMGS